MTFILVADIGGTNARFGLVEQSGATPNYIAARQTTLKCSNYPDIGTMVKACCTEFGIDIPHYACLAIAGPIDDGVAQMTNLAWKFNIEELRIQLGMKSLHIINDFAAHAYSVPFLQNEDMRELYSAKPDVSAPICVMGPGTGFGMAILVPENGGWKIIPTEGGHASFAPTNERELAIKSFLLKDHKHISVENILSGAGLVNLYRAIAGIEGVEIQAYTPADVSTNGLSNADKLCREAVTIFCNTLGAVAGDKALSTGARGGVVIAGGITPRLIDLIPNTEFESAYKNKGPMVGYVSDIPINLIVNDKTALIGSAAWAIHNTPELKPH